MSKLLEDLRAELDQLDAAREAKSAPPANEPSYPEPAASGTDPYPMQSDPQKPLDVWQEFAMRGREPSWGQSVMEMGAEAVGGAGGAGLGFLFGGIPGAIIGSGIGAGTGAGAVDYYYNDDPWQALQKGVVAGGGAMVAEGIANKAYRGLDALISETPLANQGDEAFNAGARYIRDNVSTEAGKGQVDHGRTFPMSARVPTKYDKRDGLIGFYGRAEAAARDRVSIDQTARLIEDVNAHGLSRYGDRYTRAGSIEATGGLLRGDMFDANQRILAESDLQFGRLRDVLVDTPEARLDAIDQVGGRLDDLRDRYGLHKTAKGKPVDPELMGISDRLEDSMKSHWPRIEGAADEVRDEAGNIIEHAEVGHLVSPGEFAQDLVNFRAEVGRWIGKQNDIVRKGGTVDQDSYRYAQELYNDVLMPSVERFLEPEDVAKWEQFRGFWSEHLNKQKAFTKDFADLTTDKRFFESLVKDYDKWTSADYFFGDSQNKAKYVRDAIINDALAPAANAKDEFVKLNKFKAKIQSWKNKMGRSEIDGQRVSVYDEVFGGVEGQKALEDAEGLLNALEIVNRLDSRMGADVLMDEARRSFWSGKMGKPLYHAILRVMPKTTGIEQARLSKTLMAFGATIGAEAAKQAVEPTGRALSDLFGNYQQDETTEIQPDLNAITGVIP